MVVIRAVLALAAGIGAQLEQIVVSLCCQARANMLSRDDAAHPLRSPPLWPRFDSGHEPSGESGCRPGALPSNDRLKRELLSAWEREFLHLPGRLSWK